MKHLSLTSHVLRAIIALGTFVGCLLPVRGQFIYNQDFKGTSAAGWVFGSGAGSPYTPTLTAAAGIDPLGDGWLRMTDLQANEATFARLTTPIPSANNNITVALDLAMWNKGAGGAADGITISLRDASVPFAPGAYGGSLGYANRSDGGGVAGMAGGYFSLGIDNYGNFSNPTEGRNGGTGFVPNSIATRGPGNGQTGYAYLGGTGDLSTAPYNMGNLDFPNATSRPVQTGVDYRQLVFNLDSSSILTVSLKLGATGTLTQIYTADLSAFARPENLELVYTGSTGGGQQINEIRSLVVTTTAAPVGNVYYSNYANDNKWGTGANWGDANIANLGLVPGPTANLIFSNNAFSSPAFQLTTAQNIDLQQNRTAASIQFDAPFNYTLQGFQLTLDNGATASTAITVTSAQPGGAHTIESNLQLNSNLNINTNTNTALVLAGNINAGTHTFTLNNLGTTTFAGQITGSGAMVQNSAGTIVISGNSSSTYTGNIDIQKGTLQLGGSNVLNANTNLSLSSANGTGTFNLAGNNQTLGSLTFASGGLVTTGAGTLTLGGNVTSNASATAAQILGNLNLGAADRTFTVAQGGADPDMTIAAAISSTGGGFIKAGTGSALLSGNNSYTGATSILAGTLIAAHDNALGSASIGTSTTVANSATLALQGGINLNLLETINLSGTGESGRNGALDNISGNNSVAGPVTLLANSTVGAAGGTQLSVNGAIGESGGAKALTANGAGTIVLGGSNTYTGATTVNSGTTLVAAANNALGTTTTGTTVASGGTLGFSGGITYSTAEAVSVGGTGVAGSNGAIDNISGNNSFAGAITMTANTTIGAADGTTLTLNGVLGQSGAHALTVGGTGTVVLGGASANTYTGATLVNSGATLVAAKNGAMGTNTAGTTITSGATLGFQGGIAYATTEALSVSGAGATNRNGAIENLSGTNSFSGAVTLTGDTTMNAAAGSQLTLAGVISGAFNLTKNGGGTLTLTAADTFSGATIVSGGTLALAGTSGALTATPSLAVNTATLLLDNSATNNANRLATSTALTLNDGTLTFLGNTTAGSTETTGTLTLGSGGNTLNIATGTASLTSALTLGDIIRSGSSTLTINAYSNAALATRATLGQGGNGSPSVFLTTDNFNASSGLSLSGASINNPIALPGWITTVNSSGATEFVEYSGDSGTGNGIRPITAYTGNSGINVNDPTKVVQLTSASPQTAWLLDVPGPTSAPVNSGPSVNRSGAVNGTVTVDGGLKLVDIGTVDLNSNAAYTLVLKNGGLIKTGGTTTNLQGAGALTSGNGFLAVTVDNALGVLNLSAPIVDNSTNRATAGAVSLTKAGPGLLTLGGTNTYTGGNFFTDGTVRISSERNLGAVANGVTFSGGTLNVTGSFTTNTAKIFTVTAAQSGTFDINNAITLTLANTAGVLTTADANGTVNKIGTGRLVIQNANTGFDGTMNIGAGTLEIDNAQSLGDATNRGRVILSGGTLDLRNNAATNFSNNLTVTADSAINVDRVGSGTNLTHTVGTLAIGPNTLSITGGNGFDLAIGATTLSGAARINTNTVGSDLTIGAISGTGSLTKGGGATMTLSGGNTYTGATTINGGTLRVGSGTALLPAATDLTVASGATFDQNGFAQSLASLAGAGNVTLGAGSLTVGAGNSNTTFGGGISGSGGFTKNGTGTLLLSGTNSFTGNLALNQGTIAYGTSNVLADSVAVNVAAPATLNLANNSDTIGSLAGAGAIQLGSGTLTTGGNNASTSVTGVISGAGGNLVKAGTGTMTVSAGNTFSGTTSINSGILAINNSAAVGAGDGTAATGTTIASGATLQVSGAINVANEALLLSGTGASGNGALQNVSGNNTLGGTLALNGGASLVVNAGNLTLANTVSNNGNTLTVGGTGNTLAGGAIVGLGGLAKTGAGALILNNTANTYTGATALNSGSIQIGVNNAGPVNSAVTIAAGATLDVNNKSAAIASLAGASGSSVILGTGTLAAGSNNSSTSYAGVISGAGGGLTKTGSGNLTLSGANTYTGTTNVNAGTLSAGANNVLTNQTAVTIASGAAFTLNNTTQAVGSIAGAGAINLGSGQLVAGASNASTTYGGTMSGSGSFTKDGSGNLTFTGANTFTGATTVANGTLTLGADNALSSSTSLSISNGATLSVGSGVTDQIAGLTTSTSSAVNLNANSVLTVNHATNTNLLGAFTGNGTLAFTGGGNLTLGADLSLAGGTLAFGGTTIGQTPTSTLFLGGNDLTLGTLRITGDTILDFGNSTASVLTATSFVITDPNIHITIRNWVEWQDFFYAANWNGATLGTRGQGAETQVTFDNHAPTETNWQSWDHQITPTPEPATYGLMMGGALAGLAGFRRWRKRGTAGS